MIFKIIRVAFIKEPPHWILCKDNDNNGGTKCFLPPTTDWTEIPPEEIIDTASQQKV